MMNTTKTAVVALAALGMALVGAGCSDLKEVPITGVTGQYYQTVDGANASVTAAYSRLRDFYGQEREVSLGELGTDSWDRGNGTTDNLGFGDYSSVLSANMSVTTNRDNFASLYTGVNTANTAIAAVAQAPMTATDKATRTAEARFLRALNYHNLVRTYGAVAVDTAPTTGAVITAARTAPADIYAQLVVPDLQYAIANLPTSPSQVGRATKYAAEMLLAEVYLTRAGTGDLAQAVTLTSDVINSGPFALNADYRGLFCGPDRTDGASGVVISACDFLPANEANKEFIWSVQFSGDGVNDQYGNSLNVYYVMGYDIAGAPNLARTLEYGRPYRRARPTRHLLDLWNRTTDVRYDASFQTLWASSSGVRDTAIFLPGTPTVPAQYKGRRYVAFGENDYTAQAFPTLRKWLDQSRANVPSLVSGRDRFVWRLADAYLMRAEANIRNGNPSAAVADFNVLRRRAARPGQDNTMSATDLAAFSSSPVDFLLDERERELAGEELRWYTLARLTNVGGKNYFLSRIQTYNPSAAPNVKAYHALRPIPQEQIDRTQGGSASFPQNPGY